jgi:hypothetical protein
MVVTATAHAARRGLTHDSKHYDHERQRDGPKTGIGSDRSDRGSGDGIQDSAGHVDEESAR